MLSISKISLYKLFPRRYKFMHRMRTSLFELTIDPQKMLRYFESVNNINSFKNNNKRKQRSTYHIHLRNYFCKLLFSLHDKMRSVSVISAGHYWKVSFLFFGKFHSINNPLYFVAPWFPLYTVKPNGGSAVFFFFFFFFFSLIPLPLSFLSKVFDFSTKD